MPNRGGLASGASSRPARKAHGLTPETRKNRTASTPSTSTIPTVVTTVTRAQSNNRPRMPDSEKARDQVGRAQRPVASSGGSSSVTATDDGLPSPLRHGRPLRRGQRFLVQ